MRKRSPQGSKVSVRLPSPTPLPRSLAFLVVAMLHQRAGRNDGRRSPTPLPARSSAGFALAGPVLAGNKSGAEDSSDRSGFVHSTVDGGWTQSGSNSDRCRLTLAVRSRWGLCRTPSVSSPRNVAGQVTSILLDCQLQPNVTVAGNNWLECSIILVSSSQVVREVASSPAARPL